MLRSSAYVRLSQTRVCYLHNLEGAQENTCLKLRESWHALDHSPLRFVDMV